VGSLIQFSTISKGHLCNPVFSNVSFFKFVPFLPSRNFTDLVQVLFSWESVCFMDFSMA